jgi:hypothetical protein
MEKIFNQLILAKHTEHIDGEEVSVFITKEDGYYNVYLVNEQYKTEELNSLDHQIPEESISNIEEFFTKGFFIGVIMKYIIWDSFYGYGIAEIDLNVEFIPH